MATTFFLIAVGSKHPDYHEKVPMVWCGYEPHARSHLWKRGKEGLEQGVRFLRRDDAERSGVGGPNYGEVKVDQTPGRGIMILECQDDEWPEQPGTEPSYGHS